MGAATYPPHHPKSRARRYRPKTNLTGDTGDEAEGPEDAEGAQGFDIEAPRFPAHVVGFAGFVGHLLQDDAEKPEGDFGEGGYLHMLPPPPPCLFPSLGDNSSPHDDDDEVEKVPAVADIGAGVQDQPVSDDLQEGLHREDDEEDVLHLLLGGWGEKLGGHKASGDVPPP